MNTQHRPNTQLNTENLMTLSLKEIGNHLLGTIAAEAPLDEITGLTQGFLATLDDESFIMVHQFARTLLAARADEDADISDPEDIVRQDLVLAEIGFVRAVTGPPDYRNRCRNEVYELSPKSWELINASRANVDADVDYSVMLAMEILAHCGEQTREELGGIIFQVENYYDDPRAAVEGVRSGAITFEKLDGWFALLPIVPPTRAKLEYMEAKAWLTRQGSFSQEGHVHSSLRCGEFRPVYRAKGGIAPSRLMYPSSGEAAPVLHSR
jgi:hypothetical protein